MSPPALADPRSRALPGRAPLAGGIACEVWWASINDLHDRLLTLLDPTERQRRGNYRRAEDRARFTVGATLLRLASARLLGYSPTELVFVRECPDCGRPHGRPALLGHDLHLSVSHAGEIVLVALSTDAEIGVDVEKIDDDKPPCLVKRVLDAGEMDRFRTTPQASQAEEFFRAWTRKEAVLKATGQGLRLPMNAVGFGPDGQLTSYPDRSDLPAGTTMFDLDPAASLPSRSSASYRAALAVLSPLPAAVTHYRARGLLHSW
jgi:4'-phosphopantetheinyl transferase